MTQVKICGVCRPEDAAVVADAGADYIGVILSAGFARSRTLSEASAIFAEAHEVRRVGVFVDAAPEQIARAVDTLHLDVVQLHGAESAEAVAAQASATLVWKALHIQAPRELDALIAQYQAAAGLLIEPRVAGATGGTGVQLDWGGLAEARTLLRAHTFVLAGGLNPDNVARAVAWLNPDVVDVSSGVETVVGQKSAGSVHAFVHFARTAVIEGKADRNDS